MSVYGCEPMHAMLGLLDRQRGRERERSNREM